MRHRLILAGMFAAGLFLTGCAQNPPAAAAPPDTREADAKAIRDLEDGWNKEYESKDAAKVTAHYTDDATLMAPGMPPSTGKDAITKALTEMLKDPALSLKFHASRVEVAKSGDMAFTQGSYTLRVTDPSTKKPMDDKGSYVTVYSKQADGSWKAVSDIASSEAPPMPPKGKK